MRLMTRAAAVVAVIAVGLLGGGFGNDLTFQQFIGQEPPWFLSEQSLTQLQSLLQQANTLKDNVDDAAYKENQKKAKNIIKQKKNAYNNAQDLQTLQIIKHPQMVDNFVDAKDKLMVDNFDKAKDKLEQRTADLEKVLEKVLKLNQKVLTDYEKWNTHYNDYFQKLQKLFDDENRTPPETFSQAKSVYEKHNNLTELVKQLVLVKQAYEKNNVFKPIEEARSLAEAQEEARSLAEAQSEQQGLNKKNKGTQCRRKVKKRSRRRRAAGGAHTIKKLKKRKSQNAE